MKDGIGKPFEIWLLLNAGLDVRENLDDYQRYFIKDYYGVPLKSAVREARLAGNLPHPKGPSSSGAGLAWFYGVLRKAI